MRGSGTVRRTHGIPTHKRTLVAAALLAASVLFGVPPCVAQDMLTQHNDNFRTGATLQETLLNASNVNAATFGKLYTRNVDGDIYAQPLYLAGVDMPGRGTKNVVYVVTMRNNVYAFDADNHDRNPAAGVLWGPFHLGYLGEPEQGRPGGCKSAAYYGITSTPVIDPANKWLYLVAKTIDPQGGPTRCYTGLTFAPVRARTRRPTTCLSKSCIRIRPTPGPSPNTVA